MGLCLGNVFLYSKSAGGSRDLRKGKKAKTCMQTKEIHCISWKYEALFTNHNNHNAIST